jgi:hypothetical protein
MSGCSVVGALAAVGLGVEVGLKRVELAEPVPHGTG